MVYGLHWSLAVVTNLDSLLKFCEWEARRPGGGGGGGADSGLHGRAHGGGSILDAWVEGTGQHQGKGVEGEDGVPPRPPCIIYMDSLGMHNAHEVARNLSSWLLQEWRERKSRPSKKPRTESRARQAVEVQEGETGRGECSAAEALLQRGLPLLKPDVPQQENGYDCGVFALQYCEELIARMPNVTTGNLRNRTVPGFSSSMFSQQQMQVTHQCHVPFPVF